MRAKCWERTVIGVLAVLLSSALSLEAQGWIEPSIVRGGFAIDKTRSDMFLRKWTKADDLAARSNRGKLPLLAGADQDDHRPRRWLL